MIVVDAIVYLFPCFRETVEGCRKEKEGIPRWAIH